MKKNFGVVALGFFTMGVVVGMFTLGFTLNKSSVLGASKCPDKRTPVTQAAVLADYAVCPGFLASPIVDNTIFVWANNHADKLPRAAGTYWVSGSSDDPTAMAEDYYYDICAKAPNLKFIIAYPDGHQSIKGCGN